jgi:orotate phosphoribosyltransferase
MTNKLIELFHKRGAVKTGSFRLASGKETDLYIDARRIVLSTEGILLIKKAMLRIIQKEVLIYDVIGGMHTGADPIVGALLTNTKDPAEAFLWRKEAKTHGTQQEYEGTIPTGEQNVLLIDDVATSGGSLLRVVEGLRQLHPGVQSEGAIVVVDREEGAKEALAAQGIRLFSCLTRSDLIQ